MTKMGVPNINIQQQLEEMQAEELQPNQYPYLTAETVDLLQRWGLADNLPDINEQEKKRLECMVDKNLPITTTVQILVQSIADLRAEFSIDNGYGVPYTPNFRQ